MFPPAAKASAENVANLLGLVSFYESPFTAYSSYEHMHPTAEGGGERDGRRSVIADSNGRMGGWPGPAIY